MEMSKASAAEEAKKRGEEAPPAAAAKTGGLARFARHGSMSLRNKPKIFGGGKDKDRDASGGLPPLPQGSDERPNTPLLPSNGPEAPMTPTEEKVKKNRFSLGRKKSTML
jgi:ubiquitin carboxyl-terminal hydrolase 9/13